MEDAEAQGLTRLTVQVCDLLALESQCQDVKGD